MSDGALVDRELDRGRYSGAVEDRALSGQLILLRHAGNPPTWRVAAMRQLQSLKSLGENWDGYGAAAPRSDIVESAGKFLEFLSQYVFVPAPNIAPTRNGGVLFAWEQGPHQLEVDVCAPCAASYVYLNQETDFAVSGSLFCDSADDGQFLEFVRSFFAVE